MAEKQSTRISEYGRYRPIRNIAGERFGIITALSFYDIRRGNTRWLCRCDCGTEKPMSLSSLMRVKSCGCLSGKLISQSKITHGMRNTREYRIWASAKTRCFNSRCKSFPHYGGRGITMCDAWRDSFYVFLKDMGTCPDGHEIERVNNDGNYEPSNCRWATRTEQARNKRRTPQVTHNGETLSLKEWAAKTGIHYGTLMSRFVGRSRVPLFDPIVFRGIR